MRTQYISLLTTATLLFFSCVKEPYEKPGSGGSTNGTATSVTLSIKSDSRPSVGSRGSNPTSMLPLGSSSPSRALTPEQEGLIANVHIIAFDAAGAVVANEHIDGLSITGTSNIPFETLPGENMQIFVVANGDVNDHTGTTLDTKLKSIKTLDELNLLKVNTDGDGLSRTNRLMMIGSTIVTITKPQTTLIPVELHFLDTKVTLTVKDNITASGESITITGWDVVNIPKKSYLKERTNPSEDAVDGSTPADYTTTDGKYPFAEVNPTAKTYAHTIYLFENRRGARIDRADPSNASDKYPDMGKDDNDQRGKAWYAPQGATYMLIYGTYTKDNQMNNVVYKVFLGENPINDYNLSRGKHYNYNVKINGLTNINVDTNVEWGAASFSVDKSQNLDMDSHPDFRVLRIGGTAESVTTPAYATVQVLESDGSSPCTWLALSLLNLYRHSIKQSGNTNQQFDLTNGVGTYVRPRYTPLPTTQSEFTASTFGMTRSLTKIPFVQPAVYTYQNIMIYADAYTGTGTRTAKVKITYYKGPSGTEKAGELTYDITQSGAIQVSPNLWIENYEESAMLMHPGLPSGLQTTTTMQWGYPTTTLYSASDRFSNGNWLTANAIYTSVTTRSGMDSPTWTANTISEYRDKYPRTGEKVTEPSSLTTTGEPYFYPDLTSTTQPQEYFHPIFNSSAARYCHEKNRDTNGDGIISDSETIWYLPSFSDMWYISKNMPSGANLTGTYWTSTEETNTNTWAYTFPTLTPASSAKTTPFRVRCVRGTGEVLPDATIESTETADKTKINLASTAGVSGAFNIADVTGFTWSVTSSDATWLKIATAADGTGAVTPITGVGNKTLYAYVATQNASATASRQATIKLSRMGFAETDASVITVTQARIPATVTPTSLTIPHTAGGSAPFTIDNKSSGLEWTVTVSEDAKSWLTIAKDDKGTDAATTLSGTENATLYAYSASENPSNTKKRIGLITFSRAEQADLIINVKQNSKVTIPTPSNIWAGSNIYWDEKYTNDDGTKGRLTFKDTGDDSMNDIQGVYFGWGSLIAISADFPAPPLCNILFSPTGKTDYKFAEIPRINDLDDIQPRQAVFLDNHAPSLGIGDICKYITDRGWAPNKGSDNKWRVPTAYESEAVVNVQPIGKEVNVQVRNYDGTTIIPRMMYYETLHVSLPASGFITTAGLILDCGRSMLNTLQSVFRDAEDRPCPMIIHSADDGKAMGRGFGRAGATQCFPVRCIRDL